VIASLRNRHRAAVRPGQPVRAPPIAPGLLLLLVGAPSRLHPQTASATALMPATVQITETAGRLLARRLPAHTLPSLPHLPGIRATEANARFIPTAPRLPASPAQLPAPAARRGRIPGPPLGQLTQAITGSPRLPPAHALETARGLAFPPGPSKERRSADECPLAQLSQSGPQSHCRY
jgi:hypothetical protein